MAPQEAIERIARSTAEAGMTPAKTTLLGIEVLVAQVLQFRLRWMATQLHTFLVAVALPPELAVPDRLDALMSAAADYAKANKRGLPLGLQSGVAVVFVAVTDQAGPATTEWASSPHGRKFAVVPFPVLAETATGRVTRPQRMVVGGIYAGHLKGLVDQHVAAAVGHV